LVIVWLTCLIAGPFSGALAQATNSPAFRPELPNVGLSAIRAFAALAIVLAVFFGGVWLYRNGQRLAWRRTGSPRLNILESRTLGNRYALYVVGYEQQRFLVGSSPAGLGLISPLPPAAEPPAGAASPALVPEPMSFAGCLRQVLKRATPGATEELK
jgi:flagellar biogenesis protein FliO